jgi:hypothetical protein
MVSQQEVVAARKALWLAWAKLVFSISMLILIMVAAVGLFVAVV